VIPAWELQKDRDWKRVAEDAVFLPYGKKDKEWDWGTVSPYFTPEPIIVGDEIWFYYFAQDGRNWWMYTGDPPKRDPDAKGGSLVVEALDTDGKAIEGFTRADCTPITSDSVRHVVMWEGKPDCHLLQGRPIKLRFSLKNAKLFSFEPAIRRNHYLQSYD
jgi:hypothetical protein